MDISLQRKNNWVIIDVKGRLDSFNYEFISNKLQLLNQIGKNLVAVDLTECRFLNMQAARLIANTCNNYRDDGGIFAVIGNNRNFVKRINLFLQNDMQFYTNKDDLPKSDKNIHARGDV